MELLFPPDKASLMEPDEQLMERSQRGDQHAFERLVRRYEAPLYAFFYRLTGDATLAQDLFQETFLRAFKNRFTFDPLRRFAPWLYGIATIVWKDHLRKDRRLRRHLGVVTSEPTTAVPHQIDPLEELDKREVEKVVQEEINRLPPDYRVVVILRHYQGLRYEEISKALDLPLGTVKSRLHSALATLKARLRQRGLLPPS